ncbi:MAG: aminotransferase class V-fold PLP-dependent enzyme, partial [Patescibacteria group bacterium]|nr:aminotransferase class V-fold PLP-dependent enzyme [Patescibacteria group bacterium]
GPKGIGCLYVKNRALIAPFVTGGSQEMGLRGGTLNVPAIAGFGKAAELIAAKRESEGKRLQKLRNELLKNIKKIYPSAKLNGTLENRLPNNLNIYFPDWCASDLLIKLDLHGLSVSAGAACTARAAKPSHVIKALGYSDERASGSLRLTLGRPTTEKEIAEAIKIFKEVLK